MLTDPKKKKIRKDTVSVFDMLLTLTQIPNPRILRARKTALATSDPYERIHYKALS